MSNARCARADAEAAAVCVDDRPVVPWGQRIALLERYSTRNVDIEQMHLRQASRDERTRDRSEVLPQAGGPRRAANGQQRR